MLFDAVRHFGKLESALRHLHAIPSYDSKFSTEDKTNWYTRNIFTHEFYLDHKLIYCYYYQKIGEKLLFWEFGRSLNSKFEFSNFRPGIGNSLKCFHELCQILTKFFGRHHGAMYIFMKFVYIIIQICLQAQCKLFAHVRCGLVFEPLW